MKKMKLLLTLICAILTLSSCSKTEDDKTVENQEQNADTDSEKSTSYAIEDSNDHLKDHSADLKELGSLASDLGINDISSNANIIATIYDFTVAAKLSKSLYGEAAYEWDKADSDYARLEIAYKKQSNDDITAAWKKYSASRAAMIKLKDKWSKY